MVQDWDIEEKTLRSTEQFVLLFHITPVSAVRALGVALWPYDFFYLDSSHPRLSLPEVREKSLLNS